MKNTLDNEIAAALAGIRLRSELEYQHKRLDEARDAALAQATQERE
jgi:hypothetical protein